MTINAATPYLTLHGKGAEAVDFYKRALGATVVSLQRFGDMDPTTPEALKAQVMHAELKIGGAVVMLSDGSPADTTPPGGGSVHVALALTDEADARRAFDALSEGGTVLQPMISAPWGAVFGALTDRYGIGWMFNCEVDKQ